MFGRTAFVVLLFSSLACVAGATPAFENWKHTTGPYGGFVKDYVAWGDTGVALGLYTYRTTNDGKSWEKILAYAESNIMADSGGRVWMGGYMDNNNYTLYSRNRGGSWTGVTTSSPAYSNVFKMITTSPGHRLALKYDQTDTLHDIELLYSDDPNDLKWTIRATHGIPKWIYNGWTCNLAYVPSTNSLFMWGQPQDSIIQSFAIYRSTDMGTNWQLLPMNGIPDSTENLGRSNLDSYGISVENDGTLFVATPLFQNALTNVAHYRSTDNGDSWHPISVGIPPFTELEKISRAPNGTLFAIEVTGDWYSLHPPYGVVIASTDNGNTWAEPTNAGLPPRLAQNLFITPRGTLLASGGPAGGFYRSEDNGEHWDNSTDGMNEPNVIYTCIDSSQNVFAFLPESGMYRSSNKSSSWVRLTNGLPGYGWQIMCVAPNGSIFSADTGNGVFRSTDHGDSWVSSGSGLPTSRTSALGVSPHGTVVLYTDKGVFRSTNNGTSWIAATATIPTGDGWVDFASRSDGLILAPSSFGPYVSTDEGDHWNLQPTGLSDPYSFGECFFPDGSILIGDASSTARSTDNGLHWKSVPYIGPQSASNGLNVWPLILRHNGRLVAGLSGNAIIDTFLVASTDNGETWFDDRGGDLAGWLRVPVNAFAEDDAGNLFMAAGNGVWVDGPSTSVAETLPTSSSIHIIASPNPANTRMSVTFSLSDRSIVEIELYDCLGRLVTQEPEKKYGAGDHTVSCNTSLLPSGMYRCFVRTDVGTQSTLVGIIR